MMIGAHTRLTTGASPGRKTASFLPRGERAAVPSSHWARWPAVCATELCLAAQCGGVGCRVWAVPSPALLSARACAGSHNARHSLTSRHALHLGTGLRFGPPEQPVGVCLPAPHKRLPVAPLAAVKKPGDDPPRPFRPLNDVIVPVVLVVGLANWVRVIGTLFGPVGAIGVLSMLVTLVALCMIDFRE
jgi:hypothetical protein